MKFTNAFEGIKKIFIAEILALIASVCLTITLAFTALGYVSAKTLSTTGAVASLGGMAFFGIISAVIAIIAFVLKIMGVNKASMDEPAFKIVLYLIIGGIAVSILGGFIPNNTVKSIFSVISDVVSLAITIYIIQGIKNLAAKLNNNEMITKGDTIYKIIIAIYAIIILARIITLIFNGTASYVVALVFIIIAGILSIVQYVFYIM